MYEELVWALRCCSKHERRCLECEFLHNGYCSLQLDAAAAIEALQAEYENARQSNTILATQAHKLNKKVTKLKAAQPHWVSVEDELPEPHEYVLCCGKKGGCFVGWTLDNADVVKANGHGRAFVHGGNARTFTHWMPLPSAPEPTQEVQDDKT